MDTLQLLPGTPNFRRYVMRKLQEAPCTTCWLALGPVGVIIISLASLLCG